jgi:hypothetical protein
MAAPSQSVCAPWATADDLCSPCDDYTVPGDLMADCLLAASEVLYHLSGQRYSGECSDTVRPGGIPYDQWCGMQPYPEVHAASFWTGYRSAWPLGLMPVAEVTLGGFPVVAVSEVKLDGVVLVQGTDYRVDDYRTLVRLADANGMPRVWPAYQRMDLPDTEVGTWSVTFTYGVAPPAMGRRAAAFLACELAKACSPETFGDGTCQLPERVTTIARQGVTAVVLDPFSFLEKGRTGLYQVDLFLAAANPGGISRRATSTTTASRRRRVRRAGP